MDAARSGQYTIIEQVILFGAGISIALGFLAAFQGIGADVQAGTADAQTRLLSKYIAAGAVELVESGAEGTVRLSVPSSVAQQDYAIQLDDSGVSVVTREVRHTSSVYGLAATVDLSGIQESGPPTVALKRAESQVRLERE